MEDFEFIYELNRAVNIFNTYYDARIAPDTNMSRAQFTALLLIGRFPKITKSELARKLSCSHVAIGRIVKILVNRAYVEEAQDEHNPHSLLLTTTQTGKEAVAKATAILGQKSVPLFAVIRDTVQFDLLREQLSIFSEAILRQRALSTIADTDESEAIA